MTSRPLVQNLELRAPLSDEDRRAVLDLAHALRMLEAGTYTVPEADVPKSCAVVVCGYASRQRLTGGGARQIVGLHIPGDAVDLQHLFLDVAVHSVQMLTRGEAAFVARSDLQQIAHERPAVMPY
jgi:CRP-like cAMP-binding protein